MTRILGMVALLVTLITIFIFWDWHYSVVKLSWPFVPSILIIWLISFIAFVLSIFGLFYRPSWKVQVRNWMTVVASLALTIYISPILYHDLSVKETLLEKTVSSDEKYEVSIYHLEGGYDGPKDRIVAKLKGPLWFTKTIYIEQYMKTVESVSWWDHQIIAINGNEINLAKNETFPKDLEE